MNPIQCLPHFKPLWQAYRYKILFSGRGSGKSAHLAIFLIWLACRSKIKILCLREFQVSIEESMKAEIEKWIELSGTRKDWICNLRYIKHKYTGSKFIFRGVRNNPKSIKSMTDIGCAVFEECEDATKESLDLLIPTLRLPGSFFILAGNPKDRTCAVAQMFIENAPPPGTVIINNTYLDNPYCSADLIAEAEHMRLTDYNLYKHIWLGQYLDVSQLIMVPKITRKDIPRPTGAKVVIGVDIARQGGDRTAITVRCGKMIAERQVFPSMDRDLLVHTLQSLQHKYRPNCINVDSTGHGAWCVDMLIQSGIKNVYSINFSSASLDPKYANMRTYLYALIREYFEQGGTIPVGAISLEKELAASRYTLDIKNRTAMIPKDEIRKVLGVSPDEADSLGLAMLCEGDMFNDTTRMDAIINHHTQADLISSGKFSM